MVSHRLKGIVLAIEACSLEGQVDQEKAPVSKRETSYRIVIQAPCPSGISVY